MHELSIAENIIELITENSKAQSFSKVKKITLEIGKLSCVNAESLIFCFDSVSTNTPASGAKLEIIPVPGLGQCQDCKKQFELKELYDECPSCAGINITKLAGMDMKIKNLEVS